MLRHAFALLFAAAPVAALAAPTIAITTESFVETKVAAPGGQTKIILERMKSTVPGARVVFINTARSTLAVAANKVVIENKIDPNMAFDNSTDADAIVSVDGGKTFSPIATAKVRGANGALRPALPQEVTNIRWVLAVLPARGERRVSFVAVVK